MSLKSVNFTIFQSSQPGRRGSYPKTVHLIVDRIVRVEVDEVGSVGRQDGPAWCYDPRRLPLNIIRLRLWILDCAGKPSAGKSEVKAEPC